MEKRDNKYFNGSENAQEYDNYWLVAKGGKIYLEFDEIPLWLVYTGNLVPYSVDGSKLSGFRGFINCIQVNTSEIYLQANRKVYLLKHTYIVYSDSDAFVAETSKTWIIYKLDCKIYFDIEEYKDFMRFMFLDGTSNAAKVYTDKGLPIIQVYGIRGEDTLYSDEAKHPFCRLPWVFKLPPKYTKFMIKVAKRGYDYIVLLDKIAKVTPVENPLYNPP